MKLIAHRGGRNMYAPNTKEALLYALDLPYVSGVELDVRMTKDKKIVIIHDSMIDFVSNGSGLVKDMTYKKLLKYNFGNIEKHSHISTLASFLNDVHNDKIILIELKDKDESFADRVYKVINSYPKLNIYIASFNYELLLYFKNKYHYPCGLIIGLGQNTNRLYNHFDFNMVSYNYRNRVSKKKKTFLWTINEDKEDLESFYIITDNPDGFR